MNIKIEDFLIKLQRKPIKNMNLRIKCDGNIHLSVPFITPLRFIYAFLLQKRLWIARQLQRLQKLNKKLPIVLVNNANIYFQGLQYTLQIHQTLKKPNIMLIDGYLNFFIKAGTTEQQKWILLRQWYRKKMQQQIPTLFTYWQSIIGVKANKITIRIMKSRWGSCHPIKKHISLNLHLIEKPLICLEYVIVHELIHLLEASHNKRFYKLMDMYLPNWKEIKKKLNDFS